MSRLTACATLAVGLLALSSCKSFSYEVGSTDMSATRSAYVIVDTREKLPHATTEEIKALVNPERYGDYPFFVQFDPEGDTWREMDLRGAKLEPDIDDDRVSLKFAASFIEAHPDSLIALVVRFDDHSWKCVTDPLVPKGAAEYLITSTDILER